MAKFDIKSLIDKFTNEGTVDYTKVNEELETQNRNIVIKEASKEVDKIKEETLTNLIKELKVEGSTIEDVKLYIKQIGGSTDEAKEEVIRLTTEYNKLKTDYDTEVETRTTIEAEAKGKKQIELIKGLGITEKKQIEFFQWDFNKQVTDDTSFEDVVTSYAKENDIKTSTKYIKDDFGSSGSSKDLDISAAFKAKRELRRK